MSNTPSTPPPNEPTYPYGYGLSALTLANLYLRRASLHKWSFILNMAGFAVMMVLIGYHWLKENVFHQNGPLIWDYGFITLMFFIWGCLGFFWAYRRAMPWGLGTLHGPVALIQGLLLMLSGWGLAGWSIVLGMLSLAGWCILPNGTFTNICQ